MSFSVGGPGHVAEHNRLRALLPFTTEATGQAMNALLSYVPVSGRFVVPPGTWNTNQIITLGAGQWIEAADHTSTINYTGTGTALRIATPPQGAFHRLPNVTKSVQTWDDVDGDRTSIGVQWVNGNHSKVEVGHITGFYVGLDVRGESAGSSYNRFGLSHLGDNMIGLRMSASGAGYSNANHYLGGNIKISSSSVSGVVGSRYILGDASNGVAPPAPGGPVGNGNVFDGIALEGDYPELSVELHSSSNVFNGCRFEAASPFRFTGDIAIGNVIVGGFNITNSAGQFGGLVIQGNTQNTIISGLTTTPFAPSIAIPT